MRARVSLVLAMVMVFTARADPTPFDFGPLVELADEFGLPAPPEDAPLVLGNTGWTRVLGNSSTAHDPGIYKPAFLLKGLPDGEADLLMGWQQVRADSDADHRPATRPFTLTLQKKALLGFVVSVNDMNAFVMAVQLARRGDPRAQELYSHILAAEHFDDENFGEGVGRLRDAPSLLLARCLYQYLTDATLDPESDWKALHARLVLLRDRFPVLFSEDRQKHWAWRKQRFVEDLGASVAAPAPSPDSVEALLVAWGSASDEMRHLGYMDAHMDGDADPARAIFRRGVPAMRELARFTEDRRLTRHVSPAVMKKPASRLRLGEEAQSLLDAMKGGSPEMPAEGIAAGSEEERDYFLAAAVERERGRISGLHDVPLWILGQSHPEALVELAASLPAGGTKDLGLFSLAEMLGNSALPVEQQIEALTGLVDRLNDAARIRPVLQQLAKLDPDSCIALLRPLFDEIPRDVNEPYWTCAAANFTHVVAQLPDDGIWRDYLAVVKRSAVGLRMEMLNPLNYTYLGDKNLERRLAFLAAFLDDAELRDVKANRDRYEGPHAGFTIDRLRVCDFAAQKLASLLDFEDRPTEFWTDEQWSVLREKVRTELERRGVQPLTVPE